MAWKEHLAAEMKTWIAERCTTDRAQDSSARLFADWAAWCQQRRHAKSCYPSVKFFVRRLVELGYYRAIYRGKRVIVGIQLRQP